MELSHEDQVLLFGSCPFLDEVGLRRFERSLNGVEDRARLLTKAGPLKLLPAIASNLERYGLDRILSEEERRALSAFRPAGAAVRRDLSAALRGLLDDVGRDLCDLMVLKGFDLAHTAYPHPDLREMRDLDVLVHREDIGLVRRSLLDAGFVQGEYDPRQQKLVPLPRADIERIERSHYECFPFRRLLRVPSLDPLMRAGAMQWLRKHHHLIDGEAWFVLELDVHHNLAPDIDPNDAWSHHRSLTLDGIPVKGQAPQALLWFICARLYHEVMLLHEPNIFQLHDVSAILHRWGGELNWSEIVAICSRYHFHPSLYYVLHRVRELFGAPVPTEVLERLYPAAEGVSRLHDWGDFLPKMLGYCEVSEIRFAE